jgi:hypothetical protein
MLKRISVGLTSGIAKIKWFFSIIAERIKVEIAVIRLLGRSEKYEFDRQKLLISIGERVCDLKESKGAHVFEDDTVKEALKKLEELEEEISQLRKEAEEISALEV